MTRPVELLGIVIPARRDGENVVATARAALRSGDAVDVPLCVVVVDDGDNGDLAGWLPDDPRLVVVTSPAHGPGFARTAGAAAFGAIAASSDRSAERSWIISLDADVALGHDFVAGWLAEIKRSLADVLCGPAHFGTLAGDVALDHQVESASSWMWGDTSLYEEFVGVVNCGGCNHAVSLATCAANSSYLQPFADYGGERLIVPGDDWDFGLRARMLGFSVERVSSPVVVTSNRRIAADPIGFLAGRSYERPFEPIRDSASPASWPPDEPWSDVVSRGRARLVAHFLLKPILAGLEPRGALDWFLGASLLSELAEVAKRAPRWDTDWNSFRSALIELLFEDDVFAYCGRIARQIVGVSAQ